jgi:hypothetical protein
MIFETDTNRVLIWDNAAWVMIADTGQPPGLQLITSGIITTAGDTILDNCFSSQYDIYRIHVHATGNNGSEIVGRLRTGTNTVATNTYRWGLYGQIEAGAANNYTDANVSFFTLTYGDGFFSGDIAAPFLAQQTWLHGTQSMNVFGTYYYRTVGSRNVNATSYESFVLNSGSSSITARYSLYGYRK